MYRIIGSDDGRMVLQNGLNDLTNCFTEFPIKSAASAEIIDILKKSYLDDKVEEFRRGGCRDIELDSKFGFTVENDTGNLLLTVQNGLSTKESDYNTIGYNNMGIYLCKHADVCIQHTMVKTTGCDVIKLVLCKYVTGKVTTAIPRTATVGEFIEPTAGFSAHISVIQPSIKDSLQSQYDRSQVYLYEINNSQQPVVYPRHVLPYALIILTLNSSAPPHLENDLVKIFSDVNKKNSKPDIFANPKLQQVINQINAKGPPELLGLQAVQNVTDVLPISVIGIGATLQTKVTKSSVVNNTLLSSSENMQLQKVINQLNAKYDSESGNSENNLLVNEAQLVNKNSFNSDQLSTIISLDDYIANTGSNKLRQQTQQIDILTAGHANLLQYAKHELTPYQTLNLISAGSGQFGFPNSTQAPTSDINQLIAGYSQLQGVSLPVPTMIALDSPATAIFGQNSGANALYQQELIPIDYLSAVSSPSLVSRNVSASVGLPAFYNDQSLGYSVVAGGGNLKRSYVGDGANTSGLVIDKRARLV
ncbi:hypothetical protein HELRODRAFT_175766 [Helobdella robusta]|uniref:TASOR pseudo-PARP domain-containing protein n=1 Tax=Helobdella robusta TaxID=6412 RepID=T1F9M4_HELRO|nr:hypothetical protein HELRODRAFT_175766 [Helobdella robusta]ESO00356.1 hypothetical protein HELRODRAFT_175766 [Helobdella robusta]